MQQLSIGKLQDNFRILYLKLRLSFLALMIKSSHPFIFIDAGQMPAALVKGEDGGNVSDFFGL